MSERWLPLAPDLDQLKHQAKDLLRAMHRGERDAIAELTEHHPNPPTPERAKLADAQLVLARIYGGATWARLVLACKVIDAIWKDDVDGLRALVVAHPNLLHEYAGIRNGNWGPPMSYAANVGRDRIITMLHELGATDFPHAIDRAVLQGRIDTARMLHRMMGGPKPPPGALGTPAYSLSAEGTAFLFEIGAEMVDEKGNRRPPVDILIESDGRKPEAMHCILAMYAEHGFELPDTPTMAVFRGRLDLLGEHLRRDPSLVRRTFTYPEIFPPELGCRQPEPGSYDEHLPRTPLAGATLLHLCIEFDELETARWLLDHGTDPNVKAAIDANGFGGHTPLFSAVVSYPSFWMNLPGVSERSRKPRAAPFAQLLLDRGADPNARASLREHVGESVTRDHHDITPLEWGRVFHNKLIVSEPAMELIAERGGV